MKFWVILAPSLILENVNPVGKLPQLMKNNFQIEILLYSPVSLVPNIYMLLKFLGPAPTTTAAQPIEIQSLI